MSELTPQELLQLQLWNVHNHTKREEEVYMAEIRANVQVKWEATAQLIHELRRRSEMAAV